MSKKDREYWKRLKKIQKEHKPDKWNRRYPYNWKKEWGPFVKYDGDWDGAYLLDLIIYKLEKMLIALDLYSNEVRESLDERIKTIQSAIDLGKKIQNNDYNETSHEYQKEHCTHYVYIYRRGEFETDKPFIHKIIEPSTDEQVENKDYFGHKTAEKWCKENGWDRKEVQFLNGGEWDDEKNYKAWKEMLKEEAKLEQKDKDTFFKIIAKNYSGWWY